MKQYSGGVAKTVEEKDSELTSRQGYVTVAPIYRGVIDEEDLKTSRKDLIQLKISKRLVGGVKTQHSQNVYNWSGQPTDGRIITVIKVLPKK